IGPARDLRVFAVHEVAAAAGCAMGAVPAEPSDRDPVPDLPPAHAGTERADTPGDLVACGDREGQIRHEPRDERVVAVADPTSLDRDAHLARSRIGQLAFAEPKAA